MRTIQFKSRLLAILACVLCGLGASAYSFYVDSIYYNITGPNTVEVTYKSYSTADYSGNVVIPSTVTYDNVTYTVTAIGRSAFIHGDGLITVEIPQSVKSIGQDAFHYCKKLKSVNIPDSVTRIEDNVFHGCWALTRVDIQSESPILAPAPSVTVAL